MTTSLKPFDDIIKSRYIPWVTLLNYQSSVELTLAGLNYTLNFIREEYQKIGAKLEIDSMVLHEGNLAMIYIVVKNCPFSDDIIIAMISISMTKIIGHLTKEKFSGPVENPIIQ